MNCRASPETPCAAARSEYERLIGSAEPRHRLRQGAEDRLEVGGGTADDLEHITGRCELIHRAREFSLALAQLTQEPRILHRDYRLGGEILEKRDLLFSKRSDLLSGCGDLAEQVPVLAQRNEQHGAEAGEFKRGTDQRVVGLGAVGGLGEARPFQQRLAWVVRTRDEALAQSIGERCGYPVHRNRAEFLAVIELQAPMADPAKAVRLL
jgi:hypothetical protein